MASPLDLILHDSRHAAAEPVLAIKRKPAKGTVPVLTVGENNIPCRLWYYAGDPDSTTLTNVRKEGVSLVFSGKIQRVDGSALLFAEAIFTEIQDSREDYGYECALDLNTAEIVAAFAAGAELKIYCEITEDGESKTQFTIPIRPRVWTGDEPEPTPVVEGLIQELIDDVAALEVEVADAVASVVNKADKITGGTTDNLVKRDAGGNIADAGVAVSTDGTLASNSDAKVASEKAVKTYADTKATKVPTPTNDNIVLTDAAGNLKDSGESKLVLAQATTTQRGTSERATSDKVIAGTDDLAHVTSAGLAAWAANDSRLGYVGGAVLTVGGSTVAQGLRPISNFAWGSISFDFGPNSPLGVAQAAFRTLAYTTSILTTSGATLRINLLGSLELWEGTGAALAKTGADILPPAGTRCLIVDYDPATNAFSFYSNGAVTAFATRTRANATVLNPVTALLGPSGDGSANAYIGPVRSLAALNRIPTAAERTAYARGEYPAKDLGGAVEAVQGSTTWTDSSYTTSGGTVTTNTGGTLTVSHPGGGASASALRLSLSLSGNTCPTLRIGRAVRVIMTTAGVTGSIPVSLRDSAGTLLATATTVSTSAAQVLDFTLTATGNGSLEIHLGDTAAHAATITLAGISVLGAQVIVGPDNWCHTRGRDISGNCNDLIYGSGVVPVSPTPFIRPIEVTTAGATVTAGTVATVGTLSGVSYRDKQAIAALRQWDGVKPSMGAARPTNATGLVGAATANGTLLVESGATAAGNAVFAATKIKVLVTE